MGTYRTLEVLVILTPYGINTSNCLCSNRHILKMHVNFQSMVSLEVETHCHPAS